ncbi:hypothetical protein [Kitasatospora sp. NPDC101183]|uniref:hypothetical protein n=1 Tax=Kitasatospora sp. NPDC101183 TaxID=3364100 RepID=UPI003829FCF7
MSRLALSTYQDWWKAQADAFGSADSDGIALEAFSSGRALTDTLVGLRQLHAAKLVMTGAPRNSPVVTAVDLKSDPPTAVIEDCVDVSGWQRVDAASKAVREPSGALRRYVATASLRRFQEHWLIYDFKREAGRTC